MVKYQIFIEGEPIPQGRPRGRWLPNKMLVMYDPPRSKEYKRFVAYTIKRDKCCPKTPITGPVTLELYFYMQRPKSLAKSIKHHVKRPDADNLAKAVIDALSGIVIKDDSQITELLIQKMYAEDKIGVEIQIS